MYLLWFKPATFPGGIDKFNKYLSENSKYPVDKESDAARVFVQFVVERDGSLTSVKIMRGVSLELDTEAIRLVKASAPWIPGERHAIR
jgi:TonB family protein